MIAKPQIGFGDFFLVINNLFEVLSVEVSFQAQLIRACLHGSQTKRGVLL